MTSFDEFWEIANEREVRGVSLRSWAGEFDFVKNLKLVTWVIDRLDLWPARVEIYYNRKSRAKVSRWKSKEDATLTGFNSIEGISVISALRPNMTKMDIALRSFHMMQGYYNSRRLWIFFDGSPDFLTLDLSLRIIDRLLSKVTPKYGFSAFETMGRCYWFHAGQPTSGMSEAQHERVAAHDQIRHLEPHDPRSLARRLLDVFELNILNQNHLELSVNGIPLGKWIDEGNAGSLRQLKANVFAWFVPDDVRPVARDTLLRAGCLVVSL